MVFVMGNNSDRSSDRLTFSQRYEYEPLPEQMRLEELSSDLRREIWNGVRKCLFEMRSYSMNGYYFETHSERFIERVLGRHKRLPEDTIRVEYEEVLRVFREIILNGRFDQVLSLIEILVNDTDIPVLFPEQMGVLFEQYSSSYKLDTSKRPYWFSPQASKEQGKATQQAIETIHNTGFDGAATHLRQAAKHISMRQYADSVADSIHSVESVARMIDPKASKTLGPALNSLAKSGVLKSKILKEGFKVLYGYTNNDQGIRHALLDQDAPNVGLDEALFMYGACASFCAYLAKKHQQT